MVAPGNYFLIIQADYLSNVFEGQHENNNLRTVAISIQVPAIDLSVQTVGAPASAFSGQDMTVSWTVRNNGNDPTVGSHWIDEVVLSLDQIDDPSDRVVGSKEHDGPLNGLSSYSDSLSVFAPQGLAGQYYVFVRTDRRNEIGESNENNNSALCGVIFSLTPPSDLVVSAINAPPSGSPGEPITVSWTVANNGPNPAEGVWSDAVYLSSDQTWDIGDALLGRQTQVGPVAVGQSYDAQLTTTLPAINLGNYYVIVKTDAQNRVRETDDGNNTGAANTPTAIDVTALQIGVPQSASLIAGQEKFYKTDAPANETLRFALEGQEGSANELFGRFGQIATRTAFDFSFSRLNEANQEIVIQNTQAGRYYNLVRAEFVPASAPSENITIKAEILPFEIRQVSPTEAGNSGFSTLTIEGGKFQSTATVKLINEAGVEILPLQTNVEQSQITTLFDLREKPVGAYSVIVTNPNGETRGMADGFSIVQGGGHQVTVSVSTLASVRPNTYGRFTVSVRNKGLNDALLTTLFIFLPANSDFRLSRDREIDPLTPADLPDGIKIEDVPISIDTENSRVIPLIIPLLRRGDSLDISIDVLASATESSLSVRASLLPPMLATDITPAQSSSFKTSSQSLSSSNKAIFCLAEALRQELFRILPTLIPGVNCLKAIVDQILETLSVASEFILRTETGQKAGFEGWKSIGKIVFYVLYKTAVCIADLTPLRALKIAKNVMGAVKHVWGAYEIADLADDCTKPPPKPDDYDHITTSSIRRPLDPNDKVGP